MKVEVNLNKKFFMFSILAGLLAVGLVGVYAYNANPRFTAQGSTPAANPASFGHSLDEMDWSKTISKNVTASGFCMNNSGTMDCRTVWPSGGTGGTGVTQILAGSGVTLSPAGGTGIVTISAAGGGTGGAFVLSDVYSAGTKAGFASTFNIPGQWSECHLTAFGTTVTSHECIVSKSGAGGTWQVIAGGGVDVVCRAQCSSGGGGGTGTGGPIGVSCKWYNYNEAAPLGFGVPDDSTETHNYLCPDGLVLGGISVLYRDWTDGNAPEGTFINGRYCCNITGGGGTTSVPSGTWCGLCRDGSVNQIPCMGYNVCTGCPPGYSKNIGSDFLAGGVSPSDTDYACVKD